VDPPIHVIVNNSHVTLIGAVRSQIERIKAESIARLTSGVLAVDDRVQVAGGR
jgi:osmotically-inducible protein OsmY